METTWQYELSRIVIEKLSAGFKFKHIEIGDIRLISANDIYITVVCNGVVFAATEASTNQIVDILVGNMRSYLDMSNSMEYMKLMDDEIRIEEN